MSIDIIRIITIIISSSIIIIIIVVVLSGLVELRHGRRSGVLLAELRVLRHVHLKDPWIFDP